MLGCFLEIFELRFRRNQNIRRPKPSGRSTALVPNKSGFFWSQSGLPHVAADSREPLSHFTLTCRTASFLLGSQDLSCSSTYQNRTPFTPSQPVTFLRPRAAFVILFCFHRACTSFPYSSWPSVCLSVVPSRGTLLLQYDCRSLTYCQLQPSGRLALYRAVFWLAKGLRVDGINSHVQARSPHPTCYRRWARAYSLLTASSHLSPGSGTEQYVSSPIAGLPPPPPRAGVGRRPPDPLRRGNASPLPTLTTNLPHGPSSQTQVPLSATSLSSPFVRSLTTPYSPAPGSGSRGPSPMAARVSYNVPYNPSEWTSGSRRSSQNEAVNPVNPEGLS